ncbi:MAG: hypothetical protein ACKOAX_08555, partial [Candidatus Kapaibacterium sp.]
FKTTVPFCREVVDSVQFRRGEYSTRYVERHWDETSIRHRTKLVSAIAAGVFHDHQVRRVPQS